MSTTIYRKTESGHRAYKERSSFLTPQLRSLLIMIDGVKPASDLMKFSGVMGDVALNLVKLVDEGLIEAVGNAAAQAVAPPVVGAAPAPTAAPTFASLTTASGAFAVNEDPVVSISLRDFQKQAVKVMLDGIGPMSDPVCERIERAKTSSDVLKAVQLGVQLLRDSRRPEALQKLEALIARLP